MKCPHCKRATSSVVVKTLMAAILVNEQECNVLAYCCPVCGAIISAQADPVALANYIVDEVTEQLQQRPDASQPKRKEAGDKGSREDK
ncbi:MAG: hypothetical protein NTW87_18490 [Planctomycetota bacterium]|nr:hypothetical protein [Planctomycetota bacterium]